MNTVTTTADLITATSITLNRGEGASWETDRPHLFHGPTMWNDAHGELVRMARTAPRDGSYHKVDCTVDYADGESVYVRIDLTASYPDYIGAYLARHAEWIVSAAEQGVEVDEDIVAAYRNFTARYATS